MLLEILTSNLAAKKHRYETLGNKQYLVAPVTLIREGVLNGSNGPLLYPAEEIQKVVQEWNGMPVVVNHPQNANNQAVSARNPSVLEECGIGNVYNVRYQSISKSLVGEVWIDKTKSNLINTSIVSNIEQGNPVDVSTGLATRQQPNTDTTNTFNNTPYTATATDYKPDHLAVLPSSSGACSVADGCGILVNENGIEEVLHTLNELSHSNVRNLLRTALRERFSSAINDVYLSDVFNEFSVFEIYSTSNNKGNFYKLAYTSNDSGLTLSTEEPVEVFKKTMYEPVTTNNQKGKTMPKSTAKSKDDLVQEIVSNGLGGFLESDRDTLDGFSEEQLARVVNSKPNTPAKPAESKPVAEPVTNKTDCGCGTVTSNEQKIALEDLPQEVQALIANAQKVVTNRSQELIEQIVANAEDDRKEEVTNSLKGKSIEDLEFILSFTPKKQTTTTNSQPTAPNFMGLGGGAQTNNSNKAMSDDLEMVANQLDFAAAE